MTHAPTLLAAWQEFVRLTSQMLAAIQSENWDELALAGERRAALLPILEQGDADDGPDADILRTLQQADAEIMSLTRARMRDISDLLAKRQQGRRMRQAYDGQA